MYVWCLNNLIANRIAFWIIYRATSAHFIPMHLHHLLSRHLKSNAAKIATCPSALPATAELNFFQLFRLHCCKAHPDLRHCFSVSVATCSAGSVNQQNADGLRSSAIRHLAHFCSAFLASFYTFNLLSLLFLSCTIFSLIYWYDYVFLCNIVRRCAAS